MRRPLALIFPFILQLEELCKLPWCQSERSGRYRFAKSAISPNRTTAASNVLIPPSIQNPQGVLR